MNILTRDNSLVLRGLAILAIMFHNFLHLEVIGFSKENEMSFSDNVSDLFFSKIFSEDCNYVAELVSFLGWTGVTVFVFLTGYGLKMNYSNISNAWEFVKRNFFKLFWLLLPAILFFFVTDVISGKYSNIPKRLVYLTMLQNLDYPDFNVTPGVYWYFSLTFQLYLFYALARRLLNTWSLMVMSILSLIGLWLLGMLNIPHAFSIYRHCITGWFPIFALGVYYSKQNRQIMADRNSPFLDFAIVAMLLILMVLMNVNFNFWIFLPIVGLYLYFVLAKLVLRAGSYVSSCIAWIGRYSACIFVCHPIVRAFISRLYPRFNYLWAISLLFFLLTLILAFFYEKYYKKMLKCFVY